CGSLGSSEMHLAVQPYCAASICRGPTERSGDTGSWDGVRVTQTGIYQLCWCQPHTWCVPDVTVGSDACCLHDANFSHPVGEVEVAGPRWTLISPVVGQVFKWEMQGAGMQLEGTEVHMRVAMPDGSYSCGGRPSGSDMDASSARLAVEQDVDLPLAESPAST
ncbi:unnamed protein product, partial [Polarella glacialis]